MGQKTKFVIIGLIGFIVVTLFIAAQAFNAKQSIERERDSLKKENDALAGKVNEAMQDNQQLKARLSTIQEDLDRASQERDDLQNKYATVAKERDDLAAKLKSAPAAPEQVPVAPGGDEAYWGSVLKQKTELEFQLGNVRTELKSLQIKNEELQRDKASLELEAKNYLRDQDDLNRQLTYNKKVIDSLTQELVVEKNDKFQINSSLKTIKSENQTLRRQLKSLSSRKIALDNKIAQLQAENSGMDKSLSEMEIMLKDKMLQIDNLRTQMGMAANKMPGAAQEKSEEAVELPPIVVRPAQQGKTPEAASSIGTEAKILAVKRDNNFVIIDRGIDAGIKVGDNFQVYRGAKRIGTIEAIQVRNTISACDIKHEATPIKIGDIVR